MRRLLPTLWLLLLLPLLGLSLPPRVARAQSRGPGTVTGLVRDARNRPLANVLVRISGGPTEGSTRTGRDGRYALSGLTPGQYSIIAQKQGYTPANRDGLTIVGGQTVQLNFRLEWADPSRGGVEVLVQDASRNPIPNATVFLVANGVAAFQGTTDRGGSYIATGLGVRSFTVVVRRPGFREARVSGTVRVRPGGLTTATVTLRPDTRQVGRIAGSVRAADGSPVPNATLRLTGGITRAETTSAPAGQFLFENLVPDTEYVLEVTAEGFATQSLGRITVQNGQVTPVTIVLVPDAPSRGSLAGTVVDTAGRPVPAARVRISAGPASAQGREVQADTEGRFLFTDLPPFDSYALIVEATGFFPEGASGIAVRVGRTTTVTLLLLGQTSQPGNINGLVRERGTGRPLGDVIVDIESGPSAGLTTVTDPSGSYQILGIIPNQSYTLRFRKEGYETRLLSLIPVSAGRPSTVDVELTPRQSDVGTISGQVRQLGGGPLSGVRVTLFAGASSPLTTTTNRNGEYAFANLLPDTDYAVRVERRGFLTETRRDLGLETGQRLTVDFTLRQGTQVGTIRGQVLDLSQRPLSDATVRIIQGPLLASPTTTDDSGNFVFAGLPRGVYTLQVTANGFRTQQRGNVVVSPRATTRVTILVQQ